MTPQLTLLFAALVAFQFKQLACDYLLQFNWMATGKTRAQHWVLPLFCHAGIHGLGTALIVMLFAQPDLLWLSALDLAIHFGIDRLKAKAAPAQPSPWYWWAMGIDQMAHHLTHYGLIYLLVVAG